MIYAREATAENYAVLLLLTTFHRFNVSECRMYFCSTVNVHRLAVLHEFGLYSCSSSTLMSSSSLKSFCIDTLSLDNTKMIIFCERIVQLQNYLTTEPTIVTLRFSFSFKFILKNYTGLYKAFAKIAEYVSEISNAAKRKEKIIPYRN